MHVESEIALTMEDMVLLRSLAFYDTYDNYP